MDKFPMIWQGRSLGELTAEQEALYTCFSVRSRLPGPGLWCAWAVGDRGELRLGVLEPAGDRAVIRRRFSDRMTAALGNVVRGELRPAAGEADRWNTVLEPEELFGTPWLCCQLRDVRGALTRKEGKRLFLAMPYDKEKCFPLPALFCFARICRIGGNRYAVYAFDGEEQPCFW